jgi:hypothetical protein
MSYLAFMNMLMLIFRIKFRFTEVALNGKIAMFQWQRVGKKNVKHSSYRILIPMSALLWQWLWDSRTSWQDLRSSCNLIWFKQTKHRTISDFSQVWSRWNENLMSSVTLMKLHCVHLPDIFQLIKHILARIVNVYFNVRSLEICHWELTWKWSHKERTNSINGSNFVGKQGSLCFRSILQENQAFEMKKFFFIENLKAFKVHRHLPNGRSNVFEGVLTTGSEDLCFPPLRKPVLAVSTSDMIPGSSSNNGPWCCGVYALIGMPYKKFLFGSHINKFMREKIFSSFGWISIFDFFSLITQMQIIIKICSKGEKQHEKLNRISTMQTIKNSRFLL